MLKVNQARWCAPKRRAGMTLLELVIAVTLFAGLILVAFGALQSSRMFAATNTTQVELQEYGRQALEFISYRLHNSGRFAVNPTTGVVVPLTTTGARIYPWTYTNGYYPSPHINFPTTLGYCQALNPRYNTAGNQNGINQPKAPPGVLVNGGDPTLDSSDIIFRVPEGISPEDPPANGVPRASVPAGYLNYPLQADATGKMRIMWSTTEYGFFIVPGADGINQLEYRNSVDASAQLAASKPVQGQILCRYVDRLQIVDSSDDPLLTDRQVRVTIYLTRVLPSKGALVATASDTEKISVAISCVVDMRNTDFFD